MLFQFESLTSVLLCLCVTSAKSDHFLFANSSRFTRQTTDHLGCLLPYPPPNGNLRILGSEQQTYVPNTLVEQHVIINLSCRRGYSTETGGLARAICLKNTWTPAISKLGGCARKCPPLLLGLDTLNVTCTRNNLPISCETPIEGTRAEVVCKPSFEFSAARPYTTCKDGSWDYETPCQSECGRRQIVDLRSSTPSTNEERTTAEFPWAALIYNMKSYFCSANIISRRHLLSVAHAFTDAKGVLRSVDPYTVVVGKAYYKLDDSRDIDTRTTKIAQVFVPKNYRDTQENYVLDIAVLTLETPLVFNDYIQPVCIDWDNRFESQDLKEDNKGEAFAWGPSNERFYLQNQTVLYKTSCSGTAPSSFIQKYLKGDKFCGFVDNYANLCGALAGAGFVFQNTDSRFYIRGILSVGYWRSCTTNHAEVYTRVSEHLQEIANVTGRV